MRAKLALLVLILFCFAGSSSAAGLDGIWVSDKNINDTWEINVSGDNVCTINQMSINEYNAKRISELHDCVVDMAANTISYKVYRVAMKDLDGRSKPYEYDRKTGDNKVYTAPFKLEGGQLIIGNMSMRQR